MINARDAMPAGGTLTIETGTLDLEAEISAFLAVTDTGVGMDAETQARIFEPFYTTKEVGQGTGLGLATVYGIVEQSGGHIRVASTPGVGTRIEVRLPVATAPASAAPAPLPADKTYGRETVLVVEDEDEIRILAAEMLRRRGYVVLEAREADEAMRLSQRAARIDIVVTDVVMPGLSGPELVARLSAVRPGLPALFITGYVEPAAIAATLDAGAPLLHKPFTPQELVAKVRAILDQ